MRPKDCIFCGNNTDSKEHTFLADLGGRRTNKGILCRACNGKFSELDAELAAQLRFTNGLLGVRSDHKNEPHKASVTDPKTGHVYSLDASGNLELAEPILLREEIAVGKKAVTMRFANNGQVQEWLEEQRKKGFKVERQQMTRGAELFDRSLTFKWTFGGPEALREIGRIALNFLAQEDPILVRQPELRPFKEYVLGNKTDVQCAGWGFTTDLSALPAPNFQFGHRVLLTFDKERGEVTAVVAFYSEIVFIVRLCCLCSTPVREDYSILYDIDPLADAPPNDIRVQREMEKWVSIGEISIPGPEDMSALSAALKRLLAKAADQRWKKTEDTLVPDILALDCSSADCTSAVEALLKGQPQRLFNLARAAVDHIRENAEPGDLNEMSAELMDELLKDQLDIVIEKIRQRIAQQICDDLRAGSMGGKRLRLLLEGNLGAHLAGMSVLEIIY